MVSTQDSESCDPSSNLGGTCQIFFFSYFIEVMVKSTLDFCSGRGRVGMAFGGLYHGDDDERRDFEVAPFLPSIGNTLHVGNGSK